MAKRQTSQEPDLGLSWRANEYLEHRRSKTWFIWFGLITASIAAIIYFFGGRELLPPISIILGALCIVAFAFKRPQEKKYALGADGIQVEEDFYPYEGFTRFNIFEEESLVAVHLAPVKRWAVPLTLYIPREISEEVIDHLSHVVVYDENKDSLDELLHHLRF